MFSRKTLKDRAKFVLSKSYFMTLVACLIFSMASGGFFGLNLRQNAGFDLSSASGFKLAAILVTVGLMLVAAVLFSIFVISPLSVGLKRFLLRSADGDMALEHLLFPFKNNYKNIVWVQFVKKLYIFLWSLPSYIPLALGLWKFGLYETISRLIFETQNDSIGAALSLMGLGTFMVILTLIFTIPAYIKTLQYSLVDYILAENPDLGRSNAIGKSKELMVGNKWAYIKLIFSFTGWYLLANLTCCIGTFLLEPYIQATYTQMYLEISGQGKDYDYNSQTQFENRNPFGGQGFGGF